MPLLTYYLARMAITRSDGPVSTRDIVAFIKENLQVCTDDVVFHLRELDTAGLLKKEISREKRGFIWGLQVDLPPAAVRERFPGIYDDSRIFKAIYEAAVRNNSAFSGHDSSHFETVIERVGKATSHMNERPKMEEIADIVRDIVTSIEFSET